VDSHDKNPQPKVRFFDEIYEIIDKSEFRPAFDTAANRIGEMCVPKVLCTATGDKCICKTLLNGMLATGSTELRKGKDITHVHVRTPYRKELYLKVSLVSSRNRNNMMHAVFMDSLR